MKSFKQFLSEARDHDMENEYGELTGNSELAGHGINTLSDFANRVRKAPVTYIHPNNYQTLQGGIEHSKILSQKSEEDRLKAAKDIFTNERRTDSATQQPIEGSAKSKYFDNLVTSVRSGQTPPSIVARTPKNNLFKLGGRTRAHIHMALGLPIPTQQIAIGDKSWSHDW